MIFVIMGFNDVKVIWHLFLVLCAVISTFCQTEVGDVSPFRSIILDKHNDYRQREQASNMRELEWDVSLARDAEEYSRQCTYSRSREHRSRGENLYFEYGYAKTWHSRMKFIRRALKNWHREKEYFRYGRNCGSACSFVQMVMADTYKIGCALSRCSSLTYHRRQIRHASLFVCFYSPRGKLIGDYPYERGSSCSKCPRDTRCSRNLCSNPYSSDRPSNIVDPVPPTNPDSEVGPILPNSGPLSATDKRYVLAAHNRMRQRERSPDLIWSDVLDMWASYVIRCDVEYPGPRETYTNFGKIDRSQPVQQLIYAWGKEGTNVYIHMNSGCRTPSDNANCNHNTNMMEPRLRRVGCAAMACDRKRQLICIYDTRGRF